VSKDNDDDIDGVEGYWPLAGDVSRKLTTTVLRLVPLESAASSDRITHS